jgi:hypothetical protein
MKKLSEDLGNLKIGAVDGDALKAARDEIRQAQREAREAAREASREARERVREARDRARETRVSRGDDGSLKRTLIDMRKAHIVYHDDKGELNIQNVDGKKILTAKDPQGRLVFSGPVTTKEELDKVPADVRQRYEKLEHQDIPAVSPTQPQGLELENGNNNDNDNARETMQEVSHPERQLFPHRRLGINMVLI